MRCGDDETREWLLGLKGAGRRDASHPVPVGSRADCHIALIPVCEAEFAMSSIVEAVRDDDFIGDNGNETLRRGHVATFNVTRKAVNVVKRTRNDFAIANDFPLKATSVVRDAGDIVGLDLQMLAGEVISGGMPHDLLRHGEFNLISVYGDVGVNLNTFAWHIGDRRCAMWDDAGTRGSCRRIKIIPVFLVVFMHVKQPLIMIQCLFFRMFFEGRILAWISHSRARYCISTMLPYVLEHYHFNKYEYSVSDPLQCSYSLQLLRGYLAEFRMSLTLRCCDHYRKA